MKDFKTLEVWKKNHALALSVYKVTAEFPKSELYGLTSQLRRAGTSIPANIAEGCGRFGDAELARFLQIAMGSASELEYHLILAKDLGFIKESDYQDFSKQAIAVKKMITSFLQKLRAER
jgi:four helix bundle protein